MTEEELNRLEALATHSRDNRYAFAAIEPFNLLSLIRLARIGLAADEMRRALSEIADGDEAACEIAFHALSALPKPGGE